MIVAVLVVIVVISTSSTTSACMSMLHNNMLLSDGFIKARSHDGPLAEIDGATTIVAVVVEVVIIIVITVGENPGHGALSSILQVGNVAGKFPNGFSLPPIPN